jgi:hypothetical protein
MLIVKYMKRISFWITLCVAGLLCACRPTPPRQVISLNGEWQIAKTGGELPEAFTSVAPVPGLVDLAVPALDTIVLPSEDVASSDHRPSYGYKDGWYWHRRTFDVSDTSFDVIRLKIFKARYHTKVYVNGRFAGENYYCFTPSYFDLKPFLKKGENEIIIGTGCREQLPDSILNGRDNEKLIYIPGIYDNVELTLSNRPFIDNIQCVPDVVNGKLRVMAEIEADGCTGWQLAYSISERASGRKVVDGAIPVDSLTAGGLALADFTVDMKNAKLWTPASPFLYELTLNTGADEKRVHFGMRSFRFDPARKVALLNEKPYYLRGTNVCIYRFFEDPDRGVLPWDAQWPVTLHERFKDMHWDIARYCIGFPPERWYDVCDSLGFMVQDEFPIWGIYDFTVPRIAEEYRRWMRERWNHPSVVVWDAQNETVTPLTAEAFRQVRGLDLSNRPWENGWSEPDLPADPVESHPYLFSKYMRDTEPPEGYRKELFGTVRRPNNDATDRSATTRGTDRVFPNPLIINEYGWIWLNRNGSTTTLTDRVYETLWNGSQLTPQERLHTYARHLAMLTEYWRAHRRAAGILHFCGLAYSRSEAPRGQTSDHFIDIKNLVYEPEFYKYVRPAFAPVGLMIDLWEKSYVPAKTVTAPVFVVNDLPETFEQDVALTLEKDGREISVLRQRVSVGGYEVKTIPFEVALPSDAGDYLLKAEITVNGEKVFSLRDIPVRK